MSPYGGVGDGTPSARKRVQKAACMHECATMCKAALAALLADGAAQRVDIPECSMGFSRQREDQICAAVFIFLLLEDSGKSLN